MPTLSVAPDGSHLVRDGVFFPYLADTAWSAFADATEAEWVHYLRTRARQGFTSVAISVLPILHDRSVRSDAREPFATDEAGHYDFTRPDPAYFTLARRFVELAVERGIVPTLVVLWCNYVEGTWGADLTPWAVMPAAERESYLTLVADTFAPLSPILAISGDDRFDAEPAHQTYLAALDQLSRQAPDCLLTAHSAPTAVMWDDVADSAHLDFFLYQSGHDPDPRRCWELAQRYRRRSVRKPVINVEPPYERHGYGGGQGRFTAADVRYASWASILAGASAGVGYGAHGIWQWHREGGAFTNESFSMEPFPWPSALQFRGADDIGLLGDLLIRHRLHRLDSAQHLLAEDSSGVRCGAGADEEVIAVYRPFAKRVLLARDLSAYAISAWDLERRAPIVVRPVVSDGGTLIEQPDVIGDFLLVCERRA